MSIKSFIIILVLSLLVTLLVSIGDDLRRGSLFTSETGIPFKFAFSSFFGRSSIDYSMLFLDIAFWYFIIWIIWFGIKKLINK